MRRIKKAILSLSLVAAMVMGEAGVALAAEPNQAAGGDAGISADAGQATVQNAEKGESIIIEDVDLDKANVAEVKDLDVNYYDGWNSDYLYISFSGYGCKFDVKVNGKLVQTFDNSDYVSDYDPAPSTYKSFDFYGILYGGTYKVEVVPYLNTETGPVAGTTKSTTVSVPSATISSVYYNAVSETKKNGYQKASGIYVSWYGDDDIAGTQYEVQRKEGKGAWKSIAKTTGTFYTDATAVLGKKYQYRVRYAGGKNEYGQAPAGKWKSVKDAAVNVSSVYMNVTYEGVGSGVAVGVSYEAGMCSGYEIYRSTKKTKGYKKLARITGTSYEDTKVKSGTYYYKARAYYYDEETGKTYYGDFTEPRQVKLILGSIYATSKQTGKNQVTLEWNPVAGVSGYEVWYKSDIKGDAYRRYTTTNATKLKISGLSNDTSYNFKVRAKKNGSSYYTSNETYCYVGFQAPSPYVAKTKVSSNKAKTAVTIKSTIRWDRIYGAKKIRVIGVTYGYDNEGRYVEKEKVLKTLKGTATSYTLTTKLTTKNKGYNEIRIVAVNGKDEAGSYLYGYKQLLAAKKVTVKRTSNAGSVISWKAVAGATEYDVYRTSPYGNRMLIGSTTKTKYKDLNVTPGVKYTYDIVAKNTKVNVTSFSYEAVKDYTHKLGKTKIKSAVNSSAKTATIKWGKVSYASSYIVYRATSKNGKYKKIATVKKGKTTYTDKKLKKGKTYYYKVVATGKNAAGYKVSSVLSASKSVKIKK
ncbi:MAG: fibronectin type III domain-containing protein [Clostridium sp.]|nr:fibronectin type III domain-containing protein [Clostridium sp.]MCM1398452.1 fibronectin type III domain-containing protein [Clostridium sp.]MCM1460174.1 fibronectin type III domain-containing protein [Bacteroides sp.]